MDSKWTEKRIAVVGIGGVGGYLAGRLGQVCPHLSLAARGRRAEVIRQKGLVLHSGRHGEITVRPERVVPAGQLGEQDYIFLCVKNYSLEEACRELETAVTKDTVLIPVMNGADPGDRVRGLLGRGTVVDSLIYIVAFANPDFSITQQGDFAHLRIGVRGGDEAGQRRVREVSAILTAAGIDHKIAPDIEAAIWQKYMLNCAYNVTTARYRQPIGPIRRDPAKAGEYEALVREAFQVARARGVAVTQEHVDGILHRFYHEYAEDATSSLQRDVEAGRQSELETFCGYIVREGRRLAVPVPVTERMYQALKEQEAQSGKGGQA